MLEDNLGYRADAVIDLTGDVRLTALLMQDGFWRSRIVETITIDRALAAQKKREYQVAPIIEAVREVLGEKEINADSAHVVLPLGPTPKKIMAGFHVESRLGEAFLLKRREIAEREVLHICDLAQSCSISLANEVVDFLTAICEFTPGVWQNYRYGRHRSRAISESVRRYLSDGFGFDVDATELSSWERSAEQIRSVMLELLGEPADVDSSSENVLLALPILWVDQPVETANVTKYLNSLQEFVERCVGTVNGGTRILKAIAEYGKRSQLLINCKVPLRSPTQITVVQDVPLQIGRRGSASFDVTFKDAASNYVLIRVADPTVQLKWRNMPAENAFNLVRESGEDLAIYGSDPTRPERVNMQFRLALPCASRLVGLTFTLLIFAAIVPILFLEELEADDLAVFMIPTTFAAGLVLVQQRSSLGLRLQRGLRLLILVAIVSLWIVVFLTYPGEWRTWTIPAL